MSLCYKFKGIRLRCISGFEKVRFIKDCLIISETLKLRERERARSRRSVYSGLPISERISANEVFSSSENLTMLRRSFKDEPWKF